LKYLLGIINSKFIQFYWSIFFSDSKNLFPKIKRKYLEDIPIFNATNKEQFDIIKLVEEIIDLNNNLHGSKTPHEKKLLEKQIEANDKKINNMVYELYGLTDEEIEIIEEMTK